MRKENEIKNVILNEEQQRLKQKKELFKKETKGLILNEIIKELNWKEKIIVNIFKKIFKKVSDIVRIKIINYIIEN